MGFGSKRASKKGGAIISPSSLGRADDRDGSGIGGSGDAGRTVGPTDSILGGLAGRAGKKGGGKGRKRIVPAPSVDSKKVFRASVAEGKRLERRRGVEDTKIAGSAFQRGGLAKSVTAQGDQ